MLMLHFSKDEVQAMALSPCQSNKSKNEAFEKIYSYHLAGLFFFAPLVLTSLFAGLVVQIERSSSYSVFLINLFCLCSAYAFYECLRYLPVRRLSKLSALEVKDMANRAAQRNESYAKSIDSFLVNCASNESSCPLVLV